MARKNQKTSGKPLTQKFGEGGEVNEILGKLVNVSPETVRKVKKILDNEKDKEVAKGIKALRKGDPDVSIHSVYLMCPSGGRGTIVSQPSQKLEKQISDALNGFDNIAEQFSSKEADHIYIFDKIIDWAREKRAKVVSSVRRAKSVKKGTKKTTKKGVKKTSKKSAKRATKKSSKKK